MDFDYRLSSLLDEILKVMQIKTVNGYSTNHFWTDGSEFLCDTEERAEVLADFLEALGMEPHTGYYDPKEDEINGELDNHTGWYYVDFD